MSVQFLRLFISSFTIFVGTVLLIEVIFFLFRNIHPRVKAIGRVIPILKLPLEFVFLDQLPGRIFLNPFNCESYFYDSIAKTFPSYFMNGTEPIKFSAAISRSFPPLILEGLCLFILAVSTFMVLRKTYHSVKNYQFVANLVRLASPINRSICHFELKEKLLQYNVQIVVSNKIHTPCCTLGRYILLPQKLAQELSNDEYEAVIAHEFEHLRWKDSWIKLFCEYVCAVVWWIPTKWWLQKLENDLEMACDFNIKNYGLDHHSLARAIYKVIIYVKYKDRSNLACSYLVSKRKTTLHRLQLLLKNNTPQSRFLLIGTLLAVSGSSIFFSFLTC